ncbi:MAG: hypothetical protein LKJ06_07825 [Schleiferilactobacillus harbinensis]|jgi:hypothetical protein|nr:hypothetical protein [Schleiferilactobacillus harbinensis]
MIYAVNKDGFLLGYGQNNTELAMVGRYDQSTTVQPPSNLVKPKWDGKNWIEGATAAELAALAAQQAQASQPSAEQLAINQLGVLVANQIGRTANNA